MTNITESELLRCGFYIKSLPKKTIEDYNHIIKSTSKRYNRVKIIAKKVFELVTVDYDTVLDGEIDIKNLVFKVSVDHGKHVWFFSSPVVLAHEVEQVEHLLSINSKIEYKNDHGFVYLIKSKDGYKIGKTFNIHGRRIFSVNIPFLYHIEKLIISKHYEIIERNLHIIFGKEKNHEWFDLSQNDLNYFSMTSNQISPVF